MCIQLKFQQGAQSIQDADTVCFHYHGVPNSMNLSQLLIFNFYIQATLLLYSEYLNQRDSFMLR